MRTDWNLPRYVPVRLATDRSNEPGLLQTAIAAVAATAHRWARVWANLVETLAAAAAATAYVRNLLTVARLYASLAPTPQIAAASHQPSAEGPDGLADILPEQSASSDDESGRAQAGSTQDASTPPVPRSDLDGHLRSLLSWRSVNDSDLRDARGMRSFSDGDLEATGRVRWRATDSKPQELTVSDESRRLVVYRQQLLPHSRAMTFLDERISEISRRVEFFEHRRADQEAQRLAAMTEYTSSLPQVTVACPSGRWDYPQDGVPYGSTSGRPEVAPQCRQQ